MSGRNFKKAVGLIVCPLSLENPLIAGPESNPDPHEACKLCPAFFGLVSTIGAFLRGRALYP
jgi:hypothetical protein